MACRALMLLFDSSLWTPNCNDFLYNKVFMIKKELMYRKKRRCLDVHRSIFWAVYYIPIITLFTDINKVVSYYKPFKLIDVAFQQFLVIIVKERILKFSVISQTSKNAIFPLPFVIFMLVLCNLSLYYNLVYCVKMYS